MTPFFTPREERLNSWSHAAGIALGAVAGAILLCLCLHARNGWAVAGVTLYLGGMLASYAASTVYHAARPGSRLKHVLRQWDHAAIYWHIAGSYSPITLVALRPVGAWGWGLFAFVWLCAIGGTVMSFRHLKAHSHAETACFVLMGLSILVAFGPLLRCVPASSVAWIVAEGVCYITGALFYTLHRRRYMHSVFHFLVLAGSVCHLVAVWQMLRALLG